MFITMSDLQAKLEARYPKREFSLDVHRWDRALLVVWRAKGSSSGWKWLTGRELTDLLYTEAKP